MTASEIMRQWKHYLAERLDNAPPLPETPDKGGVVVMEKNALTDLYCSRLPREHYAPTLDSAKDGGVCYYWMMSAAAANLLAQNEPQFRADMERATTLFQEETNKDFDKEEADRIIDGWQDEIDAKLKEAGE